MKMGTAHRQLEIPMPEFDLLKFKDTGEYTYVQPIRMAPITQKNIHYEWRHLGNFQSNLGSSDLHNQKEPGSGGRSASSPEQGEARRERTRTRADLVFQLEGV